MREARFALHGHPLSMPTYKVALMLRLCGLEFEEKEVDIFAPDFRRGVRSPEFLSVSRFGQIPALIDRKLDLTLVQSNVILTFLADEFRRFAPRDRVERLQVQEWMFFEAGRLFEGIAGLRYLSRFADGHPIVIENYRQHAVKQLVILDAALDRREWLVSEQPTIADISLFALTSYAGEIGFDLDRDNPSIAAWHRRIRHLEGFYPPILADAPIASG